MKNYTKYIIGILILIFILNFSYSAFSESNITEETKTSLKEQKEKVRNKLKNIEENFSKSFITEGKMNLRKSNKIDSNKIDLDEEKLNGLLASNDYYARLWSAIYLYGQTKKRYPVIKEGENWDSFIDELLKDLETVTTDVPQYGFINMDEDIIMGLLTAIGDKITPKIINSLNDKNKNNYFRIDMLLILKDLNEEMAINEALKILNQDVEDETVERNAVIVLAESNNKKKVEHLKYIIETKNKGRARDVAIVELERFAREGNEEASKVLKKVKDNTK